MLKDLGERLRTIKRDTVIFFHQIGSHGPAYSERYPAAFERFKPACRAYELQHCSQQEVVNAYDNTIAYTDHVLSRQIEMLRAAADTIDGLLIYASDHGESLGEQGVYLHGMPYRFAPRVQKEVPMLLWVSDGYAQRAQLNISCLRQRSKAPVSHDALYHTILGAAEVRDRAYDPSLDVLSSCRLDLLSGTTRLSPRGGGKRRQLADIARVVLDDHGGAQVPGNRLETMERGQRIGAVGIPGGHAVDLVILTKMRGVAAQQHGAGLWEPDQ
jgi:glucan phosphoethanolaminetransferase (alkaline phosphatase superfamily)